MTQKTKILSDFVFESGWEVCNKIGGIHTVMATKAQTLCNALGDNYILVGPDVWQEKKSPEFSEQKTLLGTWKKQAAAEGLKVRIGHWKTPGNPRVVLVDYRPLIAEKNQIYARMWDKFGVDSLHAAGDYDDACMFAVAAARVIESLHRHLNLAEKRVVAQFHEWTLGMGALWLKDIAPAISTVFTTHATTVGRSICFNNKPLYSQFTNYDGDQMARELQVEAKHSVEKQAARHADCFTTVSCLTAKECGQLLSKEPDVVTPNGFEPSMVPAAREMKTLREKARKSLLKVAACLTGCKIADDALLIATGGRYEYRNKGLDLFIEAMNRVRLASPERDIVAFMLVPAAIDGARADLQARLKKSKPTATPLPFPVFTHNLLDAQTDPVCNYLRYLGFVNQQAWRTKIILVPSYLCGDDGIFDLPYYDLLAGFDMAVFPSYYEPWGYTPLESAAFGIPTLTSDKAGFGLWALENGASATDLTGGVQVVGRTDDNYFDAAAEICKSILDLAAADAETVKKEASSAAKLAKKASWERFIKYYYKAFNAAVMAST